MNWFFQLKVLIPFYTWVLAIKHGYRKAWKIICAEFSFETGNYTDYKANEPYYNICGMRPASVREQNRTGEHNGYATFNDYWDCIEDFMLRNKAFNIPDVSNENDVKTWVSNLKKSNYFEANEQQYAKGVQHYLSSQGGHYNSVVMWFGVSFLAVCGAFIYGFYHYAQKKGGIFKG
jgi:hypothetical protein